MSAQPLNTESAERLAAALVEVADALIGVRDVVDRFIASYLDAVEVVATAKEHPTAGFRVNGLTDHDADLYEL